MNSQSRDPWTCWYDSYLAQRATLKAARRLAAERRRAATVMAGLLVAYMIVGGLVASVTVGIVMAN